MGYQMKLDEMQEALANAGHPQADAFEAALCAIGNAMATALEIQFDIIAGETEQHGQGFAGICCPFQPSRADQVLPEAMAGFDDDEAWAFDGEPVNLALMPDVPADFPVQPLGSIDDAPHATECGVCHRVWDDDQVTAYTPAPVGRCPFEAFHPEPSK